MSSNLLPQVFGRFRESHPSVSLKLFDADLRDVEAMVVGGEADMGLGFFFKAAPGLDREPVGRFQLMRVTAAARRQAPPPLGSVPWSALRSARAARAAAEQPDPEGHRRAPGARSAAPMRDRPVFNFFGTLISMVEAGFGTAVMPSFALAACRRHRVRTDVLVKPKVGLDFYRITRRGTHETEAMQAFTGTLVEALPALSR